MSQIPDYDLGQARGQIRITADTRGVQQANAALQEAERSAASARSKIEAALRNLPQIELTADSSSVDRELAEVRSRLEGLRADIDVGMNTGTADAELVALQARLLELENSTTDITLRADTRNAMNDLAGLSNDLQNIANVRPPVITPEVDGGAFQQKLRQSVTQAQRSLPDVRINPDSSAVDRAISKIRDQLGALALKRLNVDISVQDAVDAVGDLQEQLSALGSGAVEGIDELEGRLKELADLNPDVEVDVKSDISSALAGLGIIQGEIDRVRASTPTVDVNLNPNTATFAGRVTAAVRAAQASIRDITVTLSSTDAERAIASIRSELGTLGSRRIGIDISAEDAIAELERLATRLNDLDDDTATIETRADVAAALAQLRRVREEANDLDGKNINIRALLSDNGTLDSFSGRLGILIASFATLIPALVTIGAVGVAAFGGLASAAASLAPALAAVVLATSGIGEALSAGVQAQNDFAKNSRNAAQSQLSSAQAVAAAQRSLQQTVAQNAAAQLQSAQSIEAAQYRVAQATKNVTDVQSELERAGVRAARAVQSAQEDLADAVEDAARAQVSAARSVAAAQQGVQSAQKSAASGVVNAVKAQVSAQRQLLSALRSEAQAQKQLDGARKSARRNIEDLARAVRNGALDAKQASLDIRSARQSLQEALAGGDPLEIAQARLNLEKANAAAQDTSDQNSRNFEDFAEAMQAGVEGATEVVSALERLADVQQSIADAQQAQVDAAQAVADAQTDGADSVAAAEQALADARQAQIDAQLDGARSVRDAQQALSDAVEAQQLQQQQGIEATQAAARELFEANQANANAAAAADLQQLSATNSLISAQEALAAAIVAQQKPIEDTGTKFQEMYDLLSPSQQKFVDYLLQQRDVLDQLTESAAGGFLPGLQQGIENAKAALPETNQLLQTFSDILGDVAEDIGTAFAGEQNMQFFDFLERTGRPALEGMVDAVGDLIASAENIAMTFEPLLGPTMDQLTGFTQAIRDFTANLDVNPDFQAFLEYVRENAPLVRDTLKSVADAILNILAAAAEAGPTILQVIGQFANLIAAIPPDVLAALVVGFGALFLAIKGLLGIAGIVTAFQALAPVLGAIVGFLAGPVFTFITATLIPAIVSAATAIGGVLLGAIGAISAPVLIVIAVIAALVAGFVILYKNVEGFRDFIDTAWQTIAEIFTHPIDSMNAAIDFWAENIPRAFNAVLDFLENTFSSGWALVEKYMIDPLQRAYEWVENFVTNSIPGFFTNLYDTVVGFLQNQWNSVYDNFIQPLERGIQWVTELPGTIRDLIAQIPDVIRDLFADAGNFLLDAGRRIIDGLIQGIVDSIPGLRSVLDFVTNSLPDWKGPAQKDSKILVNAGQLIMTGLQNGIKAEIPELKSLLNNLGTATIPQALQAAPTSSRPTVNVAPTPVTVASGGGNKFEFNNYGSDPVRTADESAKKMRQLAALGAFGS